jgi:activator of HSP90 ATPase
MYRDSRKHSAATGMPAKISRKVGGTFTAFGGAIGGKNLAIIPEKRIVHLWRANHWKKEDWSVLILTFSRAPGGAQIDLVHVGVPQYDHKGVREGWPKYFWRPWKKFLAK